MPAGNLTVVRSAGAWLGNSPGRYTVRDHSRSAADGAVVVALIAAAMAVLAGWLIATTTSTRASR